MIDWDKPIETVDGRAAKLLSPGYWRNGETYCVVQVENPETGNSEILIVIPTSGCGHAAIAASTTVIRNAPVKREGWGRVTSNGGLPFMIGDVVFSEKASAEAACQKLGGIPAFITWEEYQ